MYLLDTHIVLWWLEDSTRLVPHVRELLVRPEQQFYMSMASVWEVRMKQSLKKLTIDYDLIAEIETEQFNLLPIEFAHCDSLLTLPHHHRDPFDRMLIAQATTEGLTLISADPHFGLYDVKFLHNQ